MSLSTLPIAIALVITVVVNIVSCAAMTDKLKVPASLILIHVFSVIMAIRCLDYFFKT